MDKYLIAAQIMRRQGSGFAAAIGDAYTIADATNRARLVAAFADLFARFFDEAAQ
jgi:hypothetical protein